jgi:proteasome accessory factor B
VTSDGVPLAERVGNLLALLKETDRALSLDEIVSAVPGYPDQHDSRRRQFARDRDRIGAMGLVVEQSLRPDGSTAYRIDRAAIELPDLGLDDAERQALQLAVAVVRLGAGWDRSGDDALLKVAGDVSDAAVHDTAPVVASLPAAPELAVFLEAAAARAEVHFGYRGQRRRLAVHGVGSRSGRWYAVGAALDRDGASRTFRLDRVEHPVEIHAPGTVERPAGFDLRAALPADPKLFGDGDVVEARVRVDAARAGAVVASLGTDAVVAVDDDGAVEVVVPVRHRSAFRSWLLELGEDACVLGPADLRSEIVAWLRAIAATVPTDGERPGSGAGSGV